MAETDETEYLGLSKEIESTDFAVIIGCASGLRFASMLAEGEKPVIRLIELCEKDKGAAEWVAQRVGFLCIMAIDTKHEHPADSALFAYLIVLEKAGYSKLPSVIRIVLATPNLFLARRFGEQILQGEQR
jgi:hypothetical protein